MGLSQESEHWRRIEELFYAALDLDAEDRSRFLQHSCGTNAQLLQEAESLLASSRQTLGFARKAVLQIAHASKIGPQPVGQRVGAYQLLNILGEGGLLTKLAKDKIGPAAHHAKPF